MDGPAGYRHAVQLMSEVTGQVVGAAGLTLADIDLFVYHQANSRIIDAVGQRLHLDPARVVNVVGLFANTSAASLPIALAAAQRAGRLHHGDRVLLAAFGAGLVWGRASMATLGRPRSYPGRVAIWLSHGSWTPRPWTCWVPAFTAASPPCAVITNSQRLSGDQASVPVAAPSGRGGSRSADRPRWPG